MTQSPAFAPASNRFRSRGLALSAAAGVGALLASSAQATIVFVNGPAVSKGHTIDFDNSGTGDITLGKNSVVGRFDHFNDANQTGQVVVLSTSANSLDELDADTLISSGSFWSNITGTTSGSVSSSADWTFGDTGYFGFSFMNDGGDTFYGWGWQDYTDSSNSSVTQWAYNDVAGEGIRAGQLVADAPVPEPATTSALAGLLVLSGAVWLKKRRLARLGGLRSATVIPAPVADV